MPDHVHDKLVKAVFGESPRSAAHLLAHLPSPIREAVDPGTLELVPGSVNGGQKPRDSGG